MNLRARSSIHSDEYLLFVHRERSPEDNEAERLLSGFLRAADANAKLRINETGDADDQTPALYTQLDYFAGIDEIKAFVQIANAG